MKKQYVFYDPSEKCGHIANCSSRSWRDRQEDTEDHSLLEQKLQKRESGQKNLKCNWANCWSLSVDDSEN